jgi:hypothetical protein
MSGENPNAVENPHAGQGSSVLLDIGGDVGALVIGMAAELEGMEIELRPAITSDGLNGVTHADEHHQITSHGHGHHHAHRLPHVAVVPRPSPEGKIVYSAVFFEVPEGSYELYVRPGGPVRLKVDVVGGQVTDAEWPR